VNKDSACFRFPHRSIFVPQAAMDETEESIDRAGTLDDDDDLQEDMAYVYIRNGTISEG